MKICCRCKTEKPLTDFYARGTTRKQSECKPCTRERRSHWWKSPAGKESSRQTKLKTRFALSAEGYDELLEKQKGVCAICGATKGSMGRRLAVDHNHTTLEIRGLLCTACNAAIGNLRDNPQLCFNAAAYLISTGASSGQ